MDNVIQFPKKNINDRFVPNDLEEIEERMEDMKLLHIQETLLPVLQNLFSSLAVAGFEFGLEDEDEDPFLKDGALVVESLKAMLCKHHGIYHPLSVMADSLFIPNDEEPGTYRIPENISITMNTKSDVE
jgi:hypothetical protein